MKSGKGQEHSEDAIRKAIVNSGVELECQIALESRDIGFDVIQSESYRDPQTSALREIDLIAYTQVTHPFSVTGSLVIECKYVPENKVALVMTRKRSFEKDLAVQQLITSKKLSVVKASFDEEIQAGHLFCGDGDVGFSLSNLTIGSRDKPQFTPHLQAINAATAYVEKYSEVAPDYHTVAIPVVVIRGQLWEGQLSSNGEVRVQKVPHSLLASRFSHSLSHSFVHVVTDEHFKRYATKWKRTLEDLLGKVEIY